MTKVNLRSQSSVRWIVLILGCSMMVGSYYCLDIPAALKTQIGDYMDNPNNYETKFQLLYTLYAAPNIILPIFGGYIIDRFGVRISLLTFSSIITLGQLIVTIGLVCKSWTVVYLGRFVFGVGGESFTVANSALLANWFIGNELAFAFGINMSFSRLGSVFNNLMSPYLLRESGAITVSFAFGTLLCALCTGIVLVTLPIDRAMDADSAQEAEVAVSSVLSPMRAISSLRNQKSKKGFSAIVNDTQSAAVNNLSGLESPPPRNKNNNDFSPRGSSASASLPDLFSGDEDSNSKADTSLSAACTKSYRDFLTLPVIFWVLVVSCVAVYGAVFPFNNISSTVLLERDYFKAESRSQCALTHSGCQSKHNLPNEHCSTSPWVQPPMPRNVTVNKVYFAQVNVLDVDCGSAAWAKKGCTAEYCKRLVVGESKASVIMSIPYVISAVLSPPLGYAVDYYGLRAVIALVAPLVLVAVHLSLGLTDCSPVWPLVGQGLAYTGFVSVLWPAIPLVIDAKVTGLAFGIVTAMQNFACAVIPLFVAAIYTASNDQYIPNVEFLFVALGVIGVLVGLYMNYYDYHHGGVLNRGFENAEDMSVFVSPSGSKKWDAEGDVEFSGANSSLTRVQSVTSPVHRIGRVSSGTKMSEESELSGAIGGRPGGGGGGKWNKKQYFQIQSSEEEGEEEEGV